MSILDQFKLDGKTALVTGGGQGIGQAYSYALAEAGAKVAIVDINLATAEETAAEIVKKGGEAIAIKTDVTAEAEVEEMIKKITAKWGRLDIGVNNAGMGVWRDALTQDFSEWRKILALNLDSVFLCARHEARVMEKQSYGKIINTASMSAHIVNTPQNQAAYNASKAGVLHLTRTLAAEWASKGIRVNSISPGYTKTALLDNLMKTPEGASMGEKWLALTPMNRYVTPADLQGAVVYLASPASDLMTGSDIIIDGGYCCW